MFKESYFMGIFPLPLLGILVFTSPIHIIYLVTSGYLDYSSPLVVHDHKKLSPIE